jgi:hypothetical protein
METQLREDVSSHYILMDIDTIYKKVKNNTICLTPQYQRGSVWTMPKKVGFIQSVIGGYPIPSFMFSQKKNIEELYNVMDGKQRIETITSFKENAFSVDIDGVRKYYKDMDERRQARFDAQVFSISISKGLTEEEESFIYERINRAMPLSGGEMIQSYLFSPFAKTRDELFNSDNPIFQQLVQVLGDDTGGRIKRNEKICNWSGYVAGCGCGYTYITTSFLRLQPLLEYEEEEWSKFTPAVEVNMKRLADLWTKVVIEDGTAIHPDWKTGSRIWRLGFLNAYILYSLLVEGENNEAVANIWRKFIKDASANPNLLNEWKRSFGNGTMCLNKKKLQDGWSQVKNYVKNNSFDKNFVCEEEQPDDEAVPEVGQEVQKNKRKRSLPKRRVQT